MKSKKETPKSSSQNLPLTRWQLLCDTLHYRFWDLCIVSLLTLVFLLPSIGWLVFAYYFGLLDYSNLPSLLLTYGINVVFMIFFGVGMGGLFYFTKKLVWGVGASLPSDFFEGVKKNAKSFSLLYCIIGLFYMVLRVDIAGLNALTTLDGFALGTFEGISYGTFFVLLCSLLFVEVELVTYEGRLLRLWRNGFHFFFGAIFTNLLILSAYLLPFLVFEFVSDFAISLLVLGFEGVFYFGFSAFFLTEYCYSLFDKSINRRQYPEIIRKGLGKINESYADKNQ
jgi:hypothetical protein